MFDYRFLQLVDFVGERFVWGSKQYISFWRSLENASIEIKCDEELRVVHIDAQIDVFQGPIQFSPTKRRCHPITATNYNPTRKWNKNKRKRADDNEEPVGVDEEGNYSDTESLAARSDSSYDSDMAASSESDFSDTEYEPDVEIFDEDEEVDISFFSYDVDDPCVDISVVFPACNIE
ncbi:hypothetical protein PVAP13_6NG213406 [Panicum virgatum]|uniref:Uncharacterized protein n=1 Tax=Panicum virgatum TaxID=38727 RepID=A0A8T0QYQ2_PANVG|nr:hypothetical protein PVAP13_6NG213406 [Panicum virgatum]